MVCLLIVFDQIFTQCDIIKWPLYGCAIHVSSLLFVKTVKDNSFKQLLIVILECFYFYLVVYPVHTSLDKLDKSNHTYVVIEHLIISHCNITCVKGALDKYNIYFLI